MKFLHTGDWHIGKKLNGYDLFIEQAAVFQQILKLAEEEEVDAIVIAGDLYDRSVPSVEAVELFNQMMYQLNIEKGYPILAISGNHDSSTRLETGGPWFEQTQFHLHTRLDQAFKPVEMDGVQFFLLPYFEPYQARAYFQNEEIKTIEEAMNYVVAEMKTLFKKEYQQVLVAHFFVAGSEKSESETTVTVGGLDAVPITLLKDFDYVALGHLHHKNALNEENARYSGSLLKYSLSERNQEKGLWVVEVKQGAVDYQFHSVTPFRDVVLIENSFSELMSPSFYEGINRENYISISLTDRGVIPNVMNQLRSIYPRIIGLERTYGRENQQAQKKSVAAVQKLNPEELIGQYFIETTGEPLSEKQESWLKESLVDLEKEE